MTSLSKARALRVAVVWTALTVLNWFLLFGPTEGLLRILIVALSAAVAVGYWASWLYYVRHPEFEQLPPRNGDKDH